MKPNLPGASNEDGLPGLQLSASNGAVPDRAKLVLFVWKRVAGSERECHG